MKSRLSKSSSSSSPSHHYVQSTMNRIQRIRNKPKKLRKYLPPPQQKFRPPTPIKIKTREYEIPKNLNKSGSMLTDTIEKSNPSGKA
ncbi:hypothetical protein EUGRSUZ_A02803 [Eucalyptus grandis]|uniref:Uncharacterized protein n=2 Tax=Eucalyptus grandis TaxID=71139 RepID=A0ACC3M9W9_EUCGR|nr:hypothetical protein EUGRSUZ_A02803 [Eucalyptus grandis]